MQQPHGAVSILTAAHSAARHRVSPECCSYDMQVHVSEWDDSSQVSSVVSPLTQDQVFGVSQLIRV